MSSLVEPEPQKPEAVLKLPYSFDSSAEAMLWVFGGDKVNS